MTKDEALNILAELGRTDGSSVYPRTLMEQVPGTTAADAGGALQRLTADGLLRHVCTYYDNEDNGYELSEEEQQAVEDDEFAHPDYGYHVKDAHAKCRWSYMVTEAGAAEIKKRMPKSREEFWADVAARLGLTEMAEDLYRTGDSEFAADRLREYVDADADGRKDILAFHQSGGPAKVREAERRTT